MLQKDIIMYSIFGLIFFSPVFWYISQDWRNENIIPGQLTMIEFDQDCKSVGTIKYSDSKTTVFKIKNTGTNPLTISNIQSFCECTEVGWDKQPILPGETGEIRITLKPNFVGGFIKAVEVSCNTLQQPYYLRVAGAVEEYRK